MGEPVDKYLGRERWKQDLQEMEKSPGCTHMVQYGNCEKKNCQLRWGMYNIVIVSGYCRYIADFLLSQSKGKLRLARVSYCDGTQDKKVVGVMLQGDKFAYGNIVKAFGAVSGVKRARYE